jgi:hypothetical protein
VACLAGGDIADLLREVQRECAAALALFGSLVHRRPATLAA